MNTRQLESFVAVAQQKSFVHAAQQLYITQPAITQQIQKLEGELGFQLLVRDKHNVELTAAGARFLEGAQQVLQIWDVTLADCEKILHQKQDLKLFYTGQANFHVLPWLVKAFKKEYPESNVQAQRISPDQVVPALKSHRVNLVLTPRDLVAQVPEIQFYPLFQDRHYCVMDCSNPLAQNKSLTTVQLEGATLLWPGERFRPRHMESVLRQLEQSGCHCQIKSNMNIDNVVIQLVGSNAVAIMPGYTCPLHPDLVMIPLESQLRVSFGIGAAERLSELERGFVAVAQKITKTREKGKDGGPELW